MCNLCLEPETPIRICRMSTEQAFDSATHVTLQKVPRSRGATPGYQRTLQARQSQASRASLTADERSSCGASDERAKEDCVLGSIPSWERGELDNAILSAQRAGTYYPLSDKLEPNSYVYTTVRRYCSRERVVRWTCIRASTLI